MTDRLFHFTCDHGHDGIGRRGYIVPQVAHPTYGFKLSWFTTEAWPDREQTGLTSRITSCDRMKYRYIVTDVADCRAWLDSAERADIKPYRLRDLEQYGDPGHWWIADVAVFARLG